jgi:hypothetical protein
MTWQEQRIGRFTASEIHKLLKSGRAKDSVFGDTAMTYIREVVAEILSGVAEKVTSEAMEWGKFHEPAAIEAYRRNTGKKIEYYGTESPLFIEYGEFAGGSPDGVTDTHLLEVKCPFRSVNHVDNLLLTPETFPTRRTEYYAQIQFNMFLTKKDKAHFISYDPRMASEEQQLFILEIPYNAEFVEEITSRLELAIQELKQMLKQIINKNNSYE